MNINLIRLCSELHKKQTALVKENNEFIEEINNQLIDDDLLVVENAKNALFDVIFVESGGSETEFKKIFPSLRKPVYLISNCKNNSLPASFEIKTYCSQHVSVAAIFLGSEEDIASMLRTVAESELAYATLKDQNLGVIGEPSDWLIASTVDPVKVHDKFNINLIKINLDELYKEIDKHKLEYIPHLDELNKKYKNKEVLNGALNIYSALKRLVNKYHLAGFTIRCFDMLTRYKNTSCLALALLNEEGITATCEGDVPSMLTMHFIRVLTGKPSFQANPSYIDMKNNQILFAHCTLPLNMTKSYSLTTHFESGLGIGIKGEMNLGEVTIAKIAPSLKINDTLVFSGTIKENKSLVNYCRTQIMVEPKDDGLISLLYKEDFGNHVIICYNDCIEGLLALLQIFELREKKVEENKK